MTEDNHHDRSAQSIAELVKQACIDAALDGLEEARIGGLCGEGAFENAISAIKMLDVAQILAANTHLTKGFTTGRKTD